MNYLFYLILFIFFITFVIDLFFEFLNWRYLLKNFKNIPDEFKEIFTTEKIEKYLFYNISKKKLGFIEGIVNFIIILFFLFSPIYSNYVSFINSLNLHYIFKAFLFFAILTAFSFLLNLPFIFYSVFVIEEKFVFNKL